MNLYHGLDNFIKYLTAERGVSPHTIDAYSRDAVEFIAFIEDESRIPDRSAMESFIAHLRKKGKSTRSIMRNLSALRSFFNFLVTSGEIVKSPMEEVEIPKTTPSIPKFLTDEEIAALLQAPKEARASLRDKVIIELLYATGLRVSELIHLKRSDVNLDGGFLVAMGKRSKERVVPINSHSKDAIK